MITCGCKGIRFCKLCEDSPRVRAINDNSSQIRDSQLFCIPCSTAGPCPHNPSAKPSSFRGVAVYTDFISTSEETTIVESIDEGDWAPSQSGRCKQDFGPRANYKKQKLKLDGFKGLPRSTLFLRERLAKLTELTDFIPAEQCNLDYLPERGSAIDFHFDDFWLWGERLVIVNLLSDSFLIFNLEEEYVKVPLPRRSLIIMRQDGRFKWKHAIAREDIVSRRISVTFRELSEKFLIGDRVEDGNKMIEIASQLI